MIEKIQFMGQNMSLVATAYLKWGDKEIEVPLKPGRNQFGKTILVPDFQEAHYAVNKERALGRL